MFSSISTLPELARLLHIGPNELNHLLCTLDNHYKHRTRRKPDGSKRHLFVPNERLKLLQKKINEHVLSKVPLLSCVQGGVKGKSVVGNASFHRSKHVVFTMDLEQCFPSIGPERVKAIYQAIGFGPAAV